MLVSQSKLALLTPNLGILWISVCSFWLCGSIVANPIIYRLVPRPSRYEIRQLSGKVTTDVRLMKHKNGYHTVMVRSQAFVLCRTKWVSTAYFGQVFHSLRRRRSLSRATYLSATQAPSTTSGNITTDVRLLKHKNGQHTVMVRSQRVCSMQNKISIYIILWTSISQVRRGHDL